MQMIKIPLEFQPQQNIKEQKKRKKMLIRTYATSHEP